MPKINENREEDLDEKDEEEEESPAEDEDTEDSDSDTEDEEESEDDDSEDEADEDESEDESDDDQDEEEKGKFTMPEKFKGKSAEEIAKAYQNLEGMVGQKALEMAQAFLTKQGIKAKPEDGKKEEDEFDLGLTDEEIAKMSPKEFARHMNRKITEKATEIAKNAIERSNEVKTNVAREIKAATKLHPHLKTNKEYRELVLDIIEAGNAKGKVITLKEACEKANKALSIKPGESKAEGEGEKKKKKPAVEKQDGSDGKPVKTEEQRVKEGMLNAGSSTFLGGLGV